MIDAPPSRALLLVNPRARQGGGGADAFVQRLEQGGLGVIPESLGRPDQVGARIAAHRGRIDRVIVAGGDGTLNAALPGVVDSGLPLGVIPLGTANDFARSMGLPVAPLEACDVVCHGRVRHCDLGSANGRYFVNVAHIGLAVEVARRSSAQAKRRLGPAAYPYAAWRAFRTRRTFSAYIRGEGDWQRIRSVQVSVGNGRFYGGGIPVAEGAAIDDGRLDLYAIRARKGSAFITMAPALRRGRAHRNQQIFSLSGTRFELRTHRHKTVSLDGEEALHTPVSFRVHPALLPVLTPARPELRSW